MDGKQVRMGGRKNEKERIRWYSEILNYISVYGNYRIERLETVAEGLNPERLISRLIDRNIYISELRTEDEMTVSFICARADYTAVEKAAGRNYIVSVRQSYGIIPCMRKFMDRKGMLIGCLIVAAMLFVQQAFVSEIEITGNNGIDEAAIRNVIAEAGLVRGARKSDIDEEEVKNELFANFDDITWANIDSRGGYMLLELVVGNSVEAEEEEGFNDIVASKSGYIERIIAKSGAAAVKEGDYVQEGDILIDSRVPVNNLTYDESRNGTFMQVDASGEVTARIVYKLEIDYGGKDYSDEELRSIADEKIKEYIRENIAEYIETVNKNLKFTEEENIIKCIVTLETIERIDEERPARQEEVGGTEASDDAGDAAEDAPG